MVLLLILSNLNMCFTLKLDFIILKPHNESFEYYFSFFCEHVWTNLVNLCCKQFLFGTSLFNEPIPFIKACFVMKTL